MEKLYCLSIPPDYYIYANVSDLHTGRYIFDAKPPILSVLRVSTVVPMVAVGKKRRTEIGQSGFLNGQHSLLELP